MRLNKYAAVIFLLMLASVPLHAQYNPYWHWAKADTLNKLTVSNGGSILAVKNGTALWSRMKSIARIVGGEAQGSWAVAEYDSTGRQLNTSAITGKVQLIDAQADAAGNWYVLGHFYDSAIFASGGLLVRGNPAVNTDGDYFMARFHGGSLNVDWVKIVGPFIPVNARAFTMDNSKIYIAADSIDCTIVRSMALATGDFISLFKQGGNSTTTSIQVDNAGSIYLAGSCSYGGMNFNGATEGPTTEQYSYIVKYRSNGTHVWHYWMRDPYCFPRKLNLFKNSFLYYTGNAVDSFGIGSAPGNPRPDHGASFIAARLDTSGAVAWIRQIDTGGGHATLGAYHAVVTQDTGLVVFVQGTDYIYWGDTFHTDNFATANAALVSYGPNGKPRWVRPIVTEYSGNQHAVTEGNAVWVTGNIYSLSASAMFDTLTLKVPARYYVPYIARTKMIRPIPVINPAGVAAAWADDISVAPIPARSALHISGLERECTLTLIDITGRKCSTAHIATGTGKFILNVTDLPRGVYMLEMSGDGFNARRKVVLN